MQTGIIPNLSNRELIQIDATNRYIVWSTNIRLAEY